MKIQTCTHDNHSLLKCKLKSVYLIYTLAEMNFCQIFSDMLVPIFVVAKMTFRP